VTVVYSIGNDNDVHVPMDFIAKDIFRKYQTNSTIPRKEVDKLFYAFIQGNNQTKLMETLTYGE
jgi:hypothetical protein